MEHFGIVIIITEVEQVLILKMSKNVVQLIIMNILWVYFSNCRMDFYIRS